MNTLLKGKTIVVMGVFNKKSIAWGCAESIQKNGGTVIYTYQNQRIEKELRKLVGDDAFCVMCDVADDKSIQDAFSTIQEKVGKIDGVVHSIAFANKEELEGQFVNVGREGFALAHEISAYSFVATCRYAAPMLNDGGSVVTMTYIGSERVIPNYNVMGIAKAALEASVRYLASDLAQYNIRVNAISAGAIRTLASSGVKEFGKLLEACIERTPQNKSVTIEEVGNVSTFLLSDLSTAITGEIIYADKGFHLS